MSMGLAGVLTPLLIVPFSGKELLVIIRKLAEQDPE